MKRKTDLNLLIRDAIKRDKSCIHLIASENILIKNARYPYKYGISSRYVYDLDKNIPQIDQNSLAGNLPNFEGNTKFCEVEKMCNDLLCDLLNAKYACVKGISGLNIMLATIGSLVLKEEKILSLSPKCGGHAATKYVAERLGVIHDYIPFDSKNYYIDWDKLQDIAKSEKIKMIYCDLMNVVSPIDIRKIRSIFGNKTIICYDASHVLGLIMGQEFQKPFEEGSDIIIGSTHKTLPGPQKGIFVTNNYWLFSLFKINSDLFISNTHIADILSLSIILDFGKKYFLEYSKRIKKIVYLFDRILTNNKMNYNLDNSHQIWIYISDEISDYIGKKIANIGIYVNIINAPFCEKKAIRIGVQELVYATDNQINFVIQVICDLINENRITIIDKRKIKKIAKCIQRNVNRNNQIDIIEKLNKKRRRYE